MQTYLHAYFTGLNHKMAVKGNIYYLRENQDGIYFIFKSQLTFWKWYYFTNADYIIALKLYTR